MQTLKNLPKLAKIPRWLYVLLISVFATACTNPADPGTDATGRLIISWDEKHSMEKQSGPTAITTVRVIVSTGDLDTGDFKILTEVNLVVSDRSAEGEIQVEKGPDRTFLVEAVDENGITQYRGSTTIDVNDDNFIVNLDLLALRPFGIKLAYNSDTGVLSWNRSNIPDFMHYRMHRSTNSPVNLVLSKLVLLSSNQDSLAFKDNDSLDDGIYFYRIWVQDTEGLLSDGSNEIRVIVVN